MLFGGEQVFLTENLCVCSADPLLFVGLRLKVFLSTFTISSQRVYHGHALKAFLNLFG